MSVIRRIVYLVRRWWYRRLYRRIVFAHLSPSRVYSVRSFDELFEHITGQNWEKWRRALP